jgi:hypothetical protein
MTLYVPNTPIPAIPRDRGSEYNAFGSMFLLGKDLTEDGTISRIRNAYSLRRGRRLPPIPEVKELQFLIVIVIVM